MDGNPYTMIAMFALLAVAFYFLMIRPQKKRQQQQQQTMSALEPGSRVLTSTGIFATVVEMGERQVVLEISPGNRLTVVKQALARAVTPDDEDPFQSAGASSAVATEEDEDEELPDSLDPIDDPDRRAALDPSDPRLEASESAEFDPRPVADDEPVTGDEPGLGDDSASTESDDTDTDEGEPPKTEDE